ncbi:MAG TPA: dienelactone hydrolase family protein [Kofleriaceae bacterium]|nr:dienelactone hydrolase family protein [Kofleriaceae bacterium]
MKSLTVILAIAACSSSPAPDLSVEQPGMYAVGTHATTLTDAGRSRTLTVQLWFPTEAAATDTPFEQLELGSNQATYAGLLAQAPSCPTRTIDVAVDAQPMAGAFPAIVFSHCQSCTRLSQASTAVRLASHGFIVAAVDHAGDDLWAHLAGSDGPLTHDELEVRAADIRFLIDQLPSLIAVDTAKVGMFGHSFGGVTAGRVAELDSRVAAAASLCAPMENPAIPGVTLANVHVPLMFIVADEDNSIGDLGNQFIAKNYGSAAPPVAKLEVPDAGHWSFSDEDGLIDAFAPGCGSGIRQTNDQPFDYLDPPTGRAIAAAYVTAFFKATLQRDAGAQAYVDSAHLGVSAAHR